MNTQVRARLLVAILAPMLLHYYQKLEVPLIASTLQKRNFRVSWWCDGNDVVGSSSQIANRELQAFSVSDPRRSVLYLAVVFEIDFAMDVDDLFGAFDGDAPKSKVASTKGVANSGKTNGKSSGSARGPISQSSEQSASAIESFTRDKRIADAADVAQREAEASASRRQNKRARKDDATVL